jgi:hypothetical protein
VDLFSSQLIEKTRKSENAVIGTQKGVQQRSTTITKGLIVVLKENLNSYADSKRSPEVNPRDEVKSPLFVFVRNFCFFLFFGNSSN